MPSFDIVSKIDLAEVDNALANLTREIATRYDFRGSKSTVTHEKGILTIFADDDLKLKQMHELLQGHLARRRIEPGMLDYQKAEPATGQGVRQKVLLKQGIAQALAKDIVKEIKGTKLKVQVSIQGDELRVSGKSRDDLQETIAFIRGLKIEQPLQFVNFRD